MSFGRSTMDQPISALDRIWTLKQSPQACRLVDVTKAAYLEGALRRPF
jgi:hypothetical protein